MLPCSTAQRPGLGSLQKSLFLSCCPSVPLLSLSDPTTPPCCSSNPKTRGCAISMTVLQSRLFVCLSSSSSVSCPDLGSRLFFADFAAARMACSHSRSFVAVATFGDIDCDCWVAGGADVNVVEPGRRPGENASEKRRVKSESILEAPKF